MLMNGISFLIVMTPAARAFHAGHKAHTEHSVRVGSFHRHANHVENGPANDSHSDHKQDIAHLN